MLICEQVTMAPVVTAMDHLLPLSSPSLSSSSSPLYFQEWRNPNPQAIMHYSDYKVDDFLASHNTTSYCNSYGSELYDSVCAAVTQQNELSQISEREKAIVIVSADSDSVTKVGDAFGQRTSVYRGVTRHRWTGRYEAHLWDNSCRREGQARKGRQVYLGGYDKEEKAARAYDLAVLKYWGPTASINFPITNYSTELEEMKHATKQEFIASLRRKSSGFSRGASMYRGVTRHHQQGRWQARIGRVAGNKGLYLGTFATEEEAAEAYDIAAIKFRGVNAVTNFEMNRYNVEAILNSNLPVGGLAKRLKKTTDSSNKKPNLSLNQQSQCNNSSSCTSRTINFGANQTSAYSFDIATTTMSSISHQSLLHHLSANAGVAQGDSSELVFGSGITPMTLVQHTPAELYIWPHQTC